MKFRGPGRRGRLAVSDEESVNLHCQFRQFAGDNVPYDRVIHIVVAVNQAVSKTYNLRTTLDFGIGIGETTPQPGAGLTDNFGFPLHRGAAFRINPVSTEIHPGGEFPDFLQGVPDIHKEFQLFRAHTGACWFSRRFVGRPGFSWPVW